MYASDYPHGESWFPKSVETVMGWDLSDDLKQKLFWDNPLRFYRRYAGVKSALDARRERSGALPAGDRASAGAPAAAPTACCRSCTRRAPVWRR